MFRTQIEISHSISEINYLDKIMTLGSCFAENIGNKLYNNLFQTDINPFGVLYNPSSICESIKLLIKNEPFTENVIFKNNSLWQSFTHSSLFSDISDEACLKKINTRLKFSSYFIKNADFLMITLGTAWIFEDKNSGNIVSNCHKLPSGNFNRRRLTVNEIILNLSEIIQLIQTEIPEIKIIFSISPIRHWKDGAHENNVSKSTLIIAVNELAIQFRNVLYFPAYEIMMDELRDYRFYAPDMLHPSDQAIDYIWKRFSETFFSEKTIVLKNKIEQLNSDFSHKPIHPDTVEYQQFIKSREIRKQNIIEENPFLKERIECCFK